MSSASNRMDWLLKFLGEQPDPGWTWAFKESAADSPINALALGNLALLAYSGADDIKKFLTNHGFKGGFQFLSGHNTFGFVARLNDSSTSPVFIERGTRRRDVPLCQ
jgi:hypothetical protein